MANSKSNQSSLQDNNSFLLSPEERNLYDQLLLVNSEDEDDYSDEKTMAVERFGKDQVGMIVKFIKLLEAEEDILAERAKTFANRKKNVAERKDFLKDQLCILVNQYGGVSKTGTKFIDTDTYKASRLVTTSKQVDVDFIPDNYKRYRLIVEVDTAAEFLMLGNSLNVTKSETFADPEFVKETETDLKSIVKATGHISTRDGVTVIPSPYIKFT